MGERRACSELEEMPECSLSAWTVISVLTIPMSGITSFLRVYSRNVFAHVCEESKPNGFAIQVEAAF